MKLKISSEQLLLNITILFITNIIALAGKKFYFIHIQTSKQEKIAVFVLIVLLSIFLTWLLRNKAVSLMRILFERITPLVWLFGIIVVLSLPLITLYAVWEPSGQTILNRNFDPSAANTDRPNIILVTYDALTARDMSLYGYHRQTTPFISEWSKSATVFSKCEASSNTTSQTTASLMTGKRVWSHRRYQSDAGKPAKIDIENLPLLLKEGGYYNMAFIANDIASVEKLGMSDSFHVMPSSSEMMDPASIMGFFHKQLVRYFGAKIKLYDWILKPDFILGILLHWDYFRYPHKTEFPLEKQYDMFLNALDNKAHEPFFTWLHLYPPHAPYLPPKKYIGLFDPSPEFRTAKSQYALITPRYYKHEQQPDADIIRSRYDEFIRYCDEQFEYFIDQLTRKGKMKNTVIILSSDHGESFTRGYFTHGSHLLFEEMTNIPLIIKDPANVGKIIDFPVEQTDIPATILDIARINIPTWMEGRSLLPLLQGKELQPEPVFSMNLETSRVRGQSEISKGIFAVWDGDYKLIYYPTSNKLLLFNLKLDPDEQKDSLAYNPVISQHLFSLIQDNIKKVSMRLSGEEIYK